MYDCWSFFFNVFSPKFTGELLDQTLWCLCLFFRFIATQLEESRRKKNPDENVLIWVRIVYSSGLMTANPIPQGWKPTKSPRFNAGSGFLSSWDGWGPTGSSPPWWSTRLGYDLKHSGRSQPGGRFLKICCPVVVLCKWRYLWHFLGVSIFYL